VDKIAVCDDLTEAPSVSRKREKNKPWSIVPSWDRSNENWHESGFADETRRTSENKSIGLKNFNQSAV
jgi:hypothetical protein